MNPALESSPQYVANLGDELSLAYLFVDYLNSEVARKAAVRKLPPVAENFLSAVCRRFPESTEWLATRSETGRLFLECGVVPRFDQDVIDRVLNIIRERQTPTPVAPQPGRGGWRTQGAAKLPPLPIPEELKKSIYIHAFAGERGHNSVSFLSYDQHGRGETNRTIFQKRRVPIFLLDEFLDPLAVVRAYLSTIHGMRESVVRYYVQRWIVQTFSIPGHADFRYALARVCDRLHELFYGTARPTRHELRSYRSATVGTELLIHEIGECLVDEDPAAGLPKSIPDALPMAIGIYLIMRLRRLLRFRYHWVDTEVVERIAMARQPDAAAPPSWDSHLPDQSIAQHELQPLVDAAHNRQCVDMLRPLEYSFLLTATLGFQSSIDGLNFIFRGGVLPREQLGRTFVISGEAGAGKTLFALHFLSDVAAKGGLALYLSLEEDYDSIVNRLVTFDFIRDTAYALEEGSVADLPAFVASKQTECTEGLLLLYRLSPGEHFSLPEVLERVETLTRDKYPLRAVAIDSINAMNFGVPNEFIAPETHIRDSIHEIVGAIDAHCSFGFLLSEKHDPRLQVVPYLVDTVIELHSGGPDEGRSLEIRKCRSQNFQRGPHSLHFSERKGLTIHPSLGAIRSTLRTRIRATLSERRVIPLPRELGHKLGVSELKEKSSVLISGTSGSGKTLLAMQLLTEPSRPRDEGAGRRFTPSNVLVVTFRTPEVHFVQALRQHHELFKRWGTVRARTLRWYSPGGSITGAQIVGEIRRIIARGRRTGMPLERIVFDEVELAEHLLPSLRHEPLFWPTIIELVNTEAVTSFFVVGGDQQTLRADSILSAEVDYSFHLTRQDKQVRASAGQGHIAPGELEPLNATETKSKPSFFVELHHLPHLAPLTIGEQVEFSLDERTELIA